MQTTSPHTRQSYACGAIRTQNAIRSFTLIRFLITLFITIMYLRENDFQQQQVQSRKDSHIKDGMGYPYSHGKVDIEILFREYRKLYVNRLQDEDRQMSNLHQYFKDLIVIGCNISITSLLWAGAFANKKNCLPIYALLETIFLIISSVRSVSFLVENGAIGDSNSDRFVVASALFGIFFVYLFIIVRRVIAGYYWDLYARDVGRRNPNIGKKIDVEKALAK